MPLLLLECAGCVDIDLNKTADYYVSEHLSSSGATRARTTALFWEHFPILVNRLKFSLHSFVILFCNSHAEYVFYSARTFCCCYNVYIYMYTQRNDITWKICLMKYKEEFESCNALFGSRLIIKYFPMYCKCIKIPKIHGQNVELKLYH